MRSDYVKGWYALVAVGLAAACTGPANQEELRQRLLVETLQQANSRAAAENTVALRELHRQAGRMRFHEPSQQQALKRLLARADASATQAEALVNRLEDYRLQPGALLVGQQTEAVRAVQRVLTYRTNLRRADATLRLPRLSRHLADTTVAALTALYFGQANETQQQASLTQLQACVLADATAALQAQRIQLVIEDNIVFDRFGAFAAAESNTVKAGETYRANLLLAGSIRYSQPPRMAVDGKPISLGEGNIGQVSFKADAARLGQQNRVTAYWTGTIRANPMGRDTVFKVRVPYTITK